MWAHPTVHQAAVPRLFYLPPAEELRLLQILIVVIHKLVVVTSSGLTHEYAHPGIAAPVLVDQNILGREPPPLLYILRVVVLLPAALTDYLYVALYRISPVDRKHACVIARGSEVQLPCNAHVGETHVRAAVVAHGVHLAFEERVEPVYLPRFDQFGVGHFVNGIFAGVVLSLRLIVLRAFVNGRARTSRGQTVLISCKLSRPSYSSNRLSLREKYWPSVQPPHKGQRALKIRSYW